MVIRDTSIGIHIKKTREFDAQGSFDNVDCIAWDFFGHLLRKSLFCKGSRAVNERGNFS